LEASNADSANKLVEVHRKTKTVKR